MHKTRVCFDAVHPDFGHRHNCRDWLCCNRVDDSVVTSPCNSGAARYSYAVVHNLCDSNWPSLCTPVAPGHG